jgi:hypothetical protein
MNVTSKLYMCSIYIFICKKLANWDQQKECRKENLEYRSNVLAEPMMKYWYIDDLMGQEVSQDCEATHLQDNAEIKLVF